MSEIQAAMDWLLSHDTGASSKALMARMLGATARPMDYPHDPADIGRCFRLLRRIPAWRERLHEMADCGPCWAALVAYWNELEETMDLEVGIDWSRGTRADLTYKFMRRILDPAEKMGGYR